MSTGLPPENVSCPNCGDGVIFSGNTPEWCPQCGARLQEISVVKSRWKNAVTTIISCALFVFGGLGSCALSIYGGWRFSQSRVGALVLTALAAFVVIAHVFEIIKWVFRKP